MLNKNFIDEKVVVMMNEAPKVSVIIPVYNAEDYLRQCLDSVINQTLPDIEIICIDDGSTDCSAEILLEYSEKDTRINVVTQENQGQSSARNNALNIATGEFVVFLDSDDFYIENALEELYTLAQSETADIIGFNAFPLFENKSLEDRFQSWKTYYTRKQAINEPVSGLVAMAILTQCLEYRASSCLLFFRRAFLEKNKIRFYEGIIHEDNLFTFQCFVVAKRFIQVTSQYYGRRVRENSTMTQRESIRNLRGYFLCMINMIRFASNVQMNADEEEAVKTNIALMWDSIQRLHKNLPQDEIWNLLKNSKLEERLIFDLFLYIFPPKSGKKENVIKVSVVIPIYNAEKYIWDCLDSVLAQTLEDIEIICIDDGSTDSTSYILDLYAKQDSRIRIFTQENMYAGAARNRGIKEARGKYIFFLDADDFIDDDLLADAYLSAENTNADVVLFPIDFFDAQTHLFSTMDWSLVVHKLPDKRPFSSYDIYNDIFTITTPGPVNKFVRKQYIKREKLKFADTKRSEDIQFVLPVLAFADKITTTSSLKPKYHYRKNVFDSLETKKTIGNYPFWHGYLSVKEQLENKGVYNIFRKSFVNAALASCLYELKTHNDYKEYTKLYNKLKEDIFQSLDIYGHDVSWFNLPANYNRLCEMMDNEPSKEDYDKLHGNNEQNKLSKIVLPINEPVVSVIIPIYNAERFLWECLDSLCSQTLQNIEIICVDDGSTDETQQILKKYQEKDKRVKVIYQDNLYAGVARNNGMQYATGKYILFLDADDFFAKNMIEKLYNRIEMCQADICICKSQFYDQKNKKISPMNWSCIKDYCPKDKDVFSRKDLGDKLFLFTSPAPWTKMFKTEFVKRNNLQFQNIRTANDVAFVMTALALAEGITIVDEYLVYYRKNVATTLQANKFKEPLLFMQSLICLKNNLKKNNIINEVKASFANLVLAICCDTLNMAKNANNMNGHKTVYEYLKDTGFQILGIDNLTESEIINHKNYNEYCNIRQYSWDMYCRQNDLFQPKKGLSANKFVQPVTNNSSKDDYYYQEIQRIYTSKSFRIGRFITYIPRKVRGGICCYKEHGLKYTLGRIKTKFAGLFGGSDK